MIHNKAVAMQLIDILTEANADLIESVKLVKDSCSDSDFNEYRKNIGKVIGRINTDLIDAIVKEFPELEPDEETARKQMVINIGRQKIMDSLITARQHYEKVNSIIAQSSEPRKSLMTAFSFSDDQAQAILELKVPLDQISEQLLHDERDRLLLEHDHFEKMLRKT